MISTKVQVNLPRILTEPRSIALAVVRAGSDALKAMRAEAAQSQLETVGKELRGLMHRAGDR